MDSKPVQGRVPELVVEKLALGEASLEQQRLASPEDKARAAALLEDNAEILARYPAHKMATQIRHRIAAATPAAPRRWLWVPAMATVACALAVVLWGKGLGQFGAGSGGTGGDPVIGGGERIKGIGSKLLVYRKEGEQAAQLHPSSEAQAGDLIQLGYVANGQRFGVIVSVDARGGATLHFPLHAEASMALTRGGPVLLERAFQLDDAPSFERFFLVTADEAHHAALSVAAVLERARALAAEPHAAETAPLALPAGLLQESFLLRKKSR